MEPPLPMKVRCCLVVVVVGPVFWLRLHTNMEVRPWYWYPAPPRTFTIIHTLVIIYIHPNNHLITKPNYLPG